VQADLWFWLAANAPGAGVDDARNLAQIDQAAHAAGIEPPELARAASAIADAHAGQPLYEKLRSVFAAVRH
jgi:hypothetical protein